MTKPPESVPDPDGLMLADDRHPRSRIRSEHGPDADIEPPVLDDRTRKGLLEVDVGVRAIRQVEVSTNAEFVPSATEVILKPFVHRRVRDERGSSTGFPLEVMKNGAASVNNATFFREVESCANACSSNQRVKVILFDTHAVGSRIVVTEDSTAGDFQLRFDEAASGANRTRRKR